MEEKLYYIMDTYGCYYTMNSLNQLVAVVDASKAMRFTMAKANNIINNMIKPMQRYQYVLKEVTREDGQPIELAEVRGNRYYHTRFDDMDTDWAGYIEDMISFCSQLKMYEGNLDLMLSKVDQEICDIMHYIEFNSLDAANGYKAYKMIRDCRLRRRQIKDEREKVKAAIQAVGNVQLIEDLKTCLCQIKGLEGRTYKPRILEELFENAS